MPGGKSAVLTTSGVGGVPSGPLIPAVLNLTVTRPAAGGYITVFCASGNRPAVSNMNFKAGQTVANLIVAPACPGGKIALYNGSGGSLDLLADVFGYFRAGPSSGRGTYQSLTGSRVLDTRAGAAVSAGHNVDLQLTGRGGIPSAGVSAVLVTVTAVGATSPGYVTVFAAGTSRPLACQLNFPTGGAVPNLIVAPVGPNGAVSLFNGAGTPVHLMADVVGYFRTN